MSLTIVVTRDVQPRYRGFLGSAMLEVAPGLYVSPRLNRNVRERVWSVLADWYGELARGSIVMLWRSRGNVGGVAMQSLGAPPRQIAEIDGLLLVKRAKQLS